MREARRTGRSKTTYISSAIAVSSRSQAVRGLSLHLHAGPRRRSLSPAVGEPGASQTAPPAASEPPTHGVQAIASRGIDVCPLSQPTPIRGPITASGGRKTLPHRHRHADRLLRQGRLCRQDGLRSLSLTRAPIGPIKALLAAARAKGYHIFHTREGHRPDLADLPDNKRWRSRRIVPASAIRDPADASLCVASRVGISSTN